jgi:GH25 family lysozyme M1 (1,4-beta-N-acetylmuramidase)
MINPKVIDVSHYDAVVGDGFQAVRRAGIVGVIQKSSEGTARVDDRYADRVPKILAAGLLNGAYHFIRPSSNMEAQADFFLRCARPTDSTLISLDYEVGNVEPLECQEFILHVESKIGRKVVLYSGNTIKEKLGDRFVPFWSERRLWLAQYASKWTVQRSWKAPWLWQFTGDGIGPKPHSVPGISIDGGLDISSYEASDEQLRAEWANDVTHEPATPPPAIDPAPQPTTPSMKLIIATEFGGPSEHQRSAYGGWVDDNALGVSLPAAFPGARPLVRLVWQGKAVIAPIVDKGPWYTDDPYWKTAQRPRAERLRHGNQAGIDLTPATMDALRAPGPREQRTIKLDYWEFV